MRVEIVDGDISIDTHSVEECIIQLTIRTYLFIHPLSAADRLPGGGVEREVIHADVSDADALVVSPWSHSRIRHHGGEEGCEGNGVGLVEQAQ